MSDYTPYNQFSVSQPPSAGSDGSPPQLPARRHNLSFILSTPAAATFQHADSPDHPAPGSAEWTEYMSRPIPAPTPTHIRPEPPTPTPSAGSRGRAPVQPAAPSDPGAENPPVPAEKGTKAKSKGGRGPKVNKSASGRRIEFTAPQLLSMARAAQDIDLFTVARGEKGAREQEFADRCHKVGMEGSTALLLARLEEMLKWQADPDSQPGLDKIIEASGLGPSFGAPLDALCQSKQVNATRTEEQKAKKAKKNAEDKEGGRIIQQMAAARSQKHLASLSGRNSGASQADENAAPPGTRTQSAIETDGTAKPDHPDVDPAPSSKTIPPAIPTPASTAASSESSEDPEVIDVDAPSISALDDEATPSKKPKVLKKKTKATQRQRDSGGSSAVAAFDFGSYMQQQKEDNAQLQAQQLQAHAEQRERWKNQEATNTQVLSALQDGNRILQEGIATQAEGVKSLVGVIAALLK
ncbi:hypothetical protein BDZ89DRAFT_1145921 [Hymenopellis radicata]|nr:hypothetical protein BDZ89DRAFT_1145921 [Hymenopellis radicata]